MQKVNLFLSINEACNLDCTYCNVVKTNKKLSFEDCKKAYVYFIKFFPHADGYNIFFIWGEPMLSFLEIQQSIMFLRLLSKKIGKPISTHMPTNGTLLTEWNLRFFQSVGHQISLSIDSLDIDYSERRMAGKIQTSSVPILLQKLPLFQKYQDILRIKMVIMPDMVSSMKRIFRELKTLGFKFINIQPAHWVYWSAADTEVYIQNVLDIRDMARGDSDIKSTTLKWTERSECDGPDKKRCAKWFAEICIDSYGHILVCDAFLAYHPDDRKKYAHDNLYESAFNREKFEEYANWKYCNNTILSDKKDLTNCETCNEVKACSTLCNAIPINWKEYNQDILLSNFYLYHKLSSVWI